MQQQNNIVPNALSTTEGNSPRTGKRYSKRRAQSLAHLYFGALLRHRRGEGDHHLFYFCPDAAGLPAVATIRQPRRDTVPEPACGKKSLKPFQTWCAFVERAV